MRHVFDVLCAATGLLLLSPLLALIALAMKLEDGGPVLYTQSRVGRGFRVFRLYKFRSMIPNAEHHGAPLTRPGDARVTRVGTFLRKHKLDELPQLLNVLKGDMQLVGPRPELPRYVERFRPQYTALLHDRPGITDPASLVYRDEEQFLDSHDIEAQYLSEILPQKLKLSLLYSQERTFFSDLGIIWRTLTAGHWTAHRSRRTERDAGGGPTREGV